MTTQDETQVVSQALFAGPGEMQIAEGPGVVKSIEVRKADGVLYLYDGFTTDAPPIMHFMKDGAASGTGSIPFETGLYAVAIGECEVLIKYIYS